MCGQMYSALLHAGVYGGSYGVSGCSLGWARGQRMWHEVVVALIGGDSPRCAIKARLGPI